MKSRILTRLLPVAALLLALPAGPVRAAATVYVSDRIEVPVYSIQAADPKMVSRTVRGGDPVEPIKRDGDWVQVREPNGGIGWMRAEHLMPDKPAREKSLQLEAERGQLLEQLDAAKARIADLAGGDSLRGIAAVEQKLAEERERYRKLEVRIERAAAVLFGRATVEEPPVPKPWYAGWEWGVALLLGGFLLGVLFHRHRHCRQHGGFRITLG